MSVITRCLICGGNIVQPAYPGDGAYPVEPMCQCRRTAWEDQLRAGMEESTDADDQGVVDEQA